jgi:hypothetical protein
VTAQQRERAERLTRGAQRGQFRCHLPRPVLQVVQDHWRPRGDRRRPARGLFAWEAEYDKSIIMTEYGVNTAAGLHVVLNVL